MHRALALAILALGAVFVALTALIVANKAWRDARERSGVRRRRVLEPLVLEFAQGDEVSLLARLGREMRAGDGRVLEALLLDHAQRVRGAAREKLVRALDEQGYVERYLTGLRSRRGWRRARAAEKLGLSGARRAIPDLARALGDPVADVRMRAAKALGALGGTAAARELVHALDEPSRWSSIRVADALVGLGRSAIEEIPAAFPALALSGRLAALDVVGRVRSLEALSWLERQLEDLEADVRARAAHALGAIGDPRSAGPLLRRLADPAWPVRAMAAKALGRIGAEPAAPALARAARDVEWWVRANAAQALGALGGAGATALEELLTSDDRFAREQAVRVLEETGAVDRRVADLVAVDPQARARAESFLRRLVAAGGRGRLDALAAAAPDTALRTRLAELLAP